MTASDEGLCLTTFLQRLEHRLVGCGEHSTFESVQAVRIDGQIGVRDLLVSANFEYPGFFVFVPDNAGWRE